MSQRAQQFVSDLGRSLNARNCGVAECLRRSVSNLVRLTCVGSNPIVGTTDYKTTQLSILPRSVNEHSEVNLRAQALDTH